MPGSRTEETSLLPRCTQPRGQQQAHDCSTLVPSPPERHVEMQGGNRKVGGGGVKAYRKVSGSLGTYMESWKDELQGSEWIRVGEDRSPQHQSRICKGWKPQRGRDIRAAPSSPTRLRAGLRGPEADGACTVPALSRSGTCALHPRSNMHHIHFHTNPNRVTEIALHC